MRSIRYILLSYLQMEFKQMFFLVLSIFWFLVAYIKIFEGDGFHDGFLSVWHLFLISMIWYSSAVSTQMIRLIQSNAGYLVPHYYRNQMLVAGILLVPFVLLPAVTVWILSLPVLVHFAMLLFTASICIWAVAVLKENEFLWFAFVIGPIIYVYVLLGFPIIKKPTALFPDLSGIPEFVFPMLLTVVSFVFLYFTGRRIIGSSINEQKDAETANADPLEAKHDKLNSMTAKIVFRNLRRLFNNIWKKKSSQFQLARMFQYSLFNPGSTVFIISLITAPLAAFFIAAGLTYVMDDRFSFVLFYVIPTPVMFLLVYNITASSLTIEFLQHRNRMPALWLYSQLSSRREFANTTVLAYLLVAAKRYLISSFAFLPVLLFFSDIFIIDLKTIPLIFLSGIVLNIFLISLSLLLSSEITSHNCIGWNITNIIAVFLLWGFYTYYWHNMHNLLFTWTFVLVTGIAGGLLLRHAIQDFAETEMDFAGPGVHV